MLGFFSLGSKLLTVTISVTNHWQKGGSDPEFFERLNPATKRLTVLCQAVLNHFRTVPDLAQVSIDLFHHREPTVTQLLAHRERRHGRTSVSDGTSDIY